MAVSVKRTDLPREVVLMLRVLAIAWVLTGHALIISDRSVPFFPFLGSLADSSVMVWAELVIGGVCAVQLVLGRAMRASALTLGALIFASPLLSRTFFSNNRLYVACLLVLAGLESAKGPPRLLRAQVIVMYLAAGFDKLLDADWRSGAFMRSFLNGLDAHGRFWAPFHESGSPYWPARTIGAWVGGNERLALAASWGTFVLEIGIAAAFILGRHRLAIAAGIVFHGGILVVTGGPMGMFFYAALASYLAFARLPDPKRASSPLDSIVSRPAFYIAAAVILSGPWFTPWSVLVLVPLFALLRDPPEVRQVAG